MVLEMFLSDPKEVPIKNIHTDGKTRQFDIAVSSLCAKLVNACTDYLRWI